MAESKSQEISFDSSSLQFWEEWPPSASAQLVADVLITFLILVIKHSTRAAYGRMGFFGLTDGGSSPSWRKSHWSEEQEAASHTASTVRKPKERHACAQFAFPSYKGPTPPPPPGNGADTFRLDFPILAILI